MPTSYFTFMGAVLIILLAGMSIFLLQNELVRKKSVNWLYLLTGILAFYCIEKSHYGQPFIHTFLLVIALYIIPISIDGIIDRNPKSRH